MLDYSISVLTMPPTEEDYGEGLAKKQMIMELDMETWRVRLNKSMRSLLF